MHLLRHGFQTSCSFEIHKQTPILMSSCDKSIQKNRVIQDANVAVLLGHQPPTRHEAQLSLSLNCFRKGIVLQATSFTIWQAQARLLCLTAFGFGAGFCYFRVLGPMDLAPGRAMESYVGGILDKVRDPAWESQGLTGQGVEFMLILFPCILRLLRPQKLRGLGA